MDKPRFYVRIVELADASWECRRGRDVIDKHDSVEAAIDHAKRAAFDVAPSAVFAHRRDGSVRHIVSFDARRA